MSLSDEKLKYFAGFIEKEIGIVYSPQVYFQLEQRIEKIASYLGLTTSSDVYDKAVRDGISGDFRQYLLDVSTNNETSFFRDPKVFQAIEKTILPNLKTEFPKNTSFRIWCAAASFGQEPYSVAILVHEFLQKNPGHPPIEIIATDVADHAIKRCKEAKYSQLEVQRGLQANKLVEYFINEGDSSWVLKAEIKNRVSFKKQNLLESFQLLDKFNLILCRYVLIYQDTERKKEIFSRIEKAMVPNGYLVLGATESTFGLSSCLKQISDDGAIFYQNIS